MRYNIATGVRHVKTNKFKSGVMAFAVMAAVLGAALTLTRGTALAATCSVPVPYLTIQSAVDDPSCDTINVAPGAYAENVVVNRTVTILGSGGTSVLTGSFTVNAANVTINGFTIHNPTGNVGITVKTAGDNAIISNNTLSQIGTSANPDPVVAIYLENGPDNVSILNNNISAVLSDKSAQGILVGDSTASNPSLNILIDGNSISNITSASRGAYGIQVNNGASTAPAASGFTTVTIRNNTINNLSGGGWAHAIGLEGPTPNVIVEGNSISNLTDGTPVPINDAIGVFFEDNPDYASAEVHNNNFNLTAAQYGIVVHPAISGSGSADGTCNWWNSPTGPTTTTNPGGTGAQVGPRVIYQPWLIAPAPGGSCIGGNVATSKDQCKKDGWMTRTRSDGSTFKNQGDCVSYTNTGR